MSPNERRVRRGFFHSARTLVTDLPSLIAGRSPTRARSGRKPEPEWTWPRRIVFAVAGLVMAAGAAAWALHFVKVPGAAPPSPQQRAEALEHLRARRFEAAAAKFREIGRASCRERV